MVGLTASTANVNVMDLFVTELNVLLMLLDHENLSSETEEKKCAVRNLLKQLKPSVTVPEYMYMNTSVCRNGSSFVEALFENFDCNLGELQCAIKEQKKDPDQPNKAVSKTIMPDLAPPLPTTPPPEDYYEEAVPLSPGTVPEYITSRNSSSPPNSIEDGHYEDTDNICSRTVSLNRRRKNSYNDSDALSSSYESYDEEEEERAQRLTHMWPSEENSMAPVRDCRICAFLLKKKRFGQWAKQLTVIRENRLQCYKSSKDQSPYMDLPLNLCSVIYVPKKKHELRFSLPGREPLVFAVQSKEQADKWLQVVREISSLSNAMDITTSPMFPRKSEKEPEKDLDKRLSGEKQASDSDNLPNGETHRDSKENGKPMRVALSELTGTMSRAAGRKITRIMSFSTRKPPLPGETRRPSLDDDPRCGYLSVFMNKCWKEQWCHVRCGSLHLHQEKMNGWQRPHTSIVLHDCQVLPGFGPRHPFALRILRGGTELVVLETSCSEEMGRWLGVLLAETGSAPECLHYDYVDVETIANIQTAARFSFLWATSTDSRTYDEVPYEKREEENKRLKNAYSLKSQSACSERNMAKRPVTTVKHNGCNANQYGRYGKTRAEEDARRYLKEKEELEREKDHIRHALVLLRKEKREAKERMKVATDKQRRALEKRAVQLEESCQIKEGECVDLELKLTQVKENLKKCLAGGALGAHLETKPLGKKSAPPRTEVPYTESLIPVNCASEMRKRPKSIVASTKGNVLQKAMEWESKKGKC